MLVGSPFEKFLDYEIAEDVARKLHCRGQGCSVDSIPVLIGICLSQPHLEEAATILLLCSFDEPRQNLLERQFAFWAWQFLSVLASLLKVCSWRLCTFPLVPAPFACPRLLRALTTSTTTRLF